MQNDTWTSAKLQAKILAICFLHQTGVYPTEANHEIAIGHDYRLAWSSPVVEDLDKDRVSRQQQVVANFKQNNKKPGKKSSGADKLQKLVTAWQATGTQISGQYTAVKFNSIGGMTAKGVYLDDTFAPFSQMKVDTENKIYIKTWLYEKAFRK